MALPLMPKATAVWLIDNTMLSFDQIADFTGLHVLEVNGIADGEVAPGMKGFDPIVNTQLTAQEIKRCEADPKARLVLLKNPSAEGEEKRRGPRYTPLSKRQERPSAIAWLVRYHPELTDNAIMRLVGTTKPTIESIRLGKHWNSNNLAPVDPVAVGLCKQADLDKAVTKAAEDAARKKEEMMSDEQRMSLMSTDESLNASAEPQIPSSVAGFENFTLDGDDPRGKEDEAENINPDDFFNLPKGDDQPEDEQP